MQFNFPCVNKGTPRFTGQSYTLFKSFKVNWIMSILIDLIALNRGRYHLFNGKILVTNQYWLSRSVLNCCCRWYYEAKTLRLFRRSLSAQRYCCFCCLYKKAMETSFFSEIPMWQYTWQYILNTRFIIIWGFK